MKVIHALLLCSFFYGAVCEASDVRYYRLHPKALQKAIAGCPEKSPADVSCAQLKEDALIVNALARELSANPQEYGKKILSLQEQIAKQSSTVDKKDLEERLAIVTWLESPEGT